MPQNTTTQMSDSFLVGIPVILSAGYMDVYTYLLRDGVFANAQTGNIILLAVRLTERQWQAALHYALPIAAFTAGILVSLVVRWNCKKLTAVHWRQLCLLMQAVILVLAAFPGESRNILSSCLVSLACGIQLQSFRALHGYPLATTMCIGNLRTATEHLFVFFVTGQRRSLRSCAVYAGVIGLFALGAVLGNVGVTLWGHSALLLCPALLLFACAVMCRAPQCDVSTEE